MRDDLAMKKLVWYFREVRVPYRESFHTDAEVKGIGEVPMTFIRAPYIETADEQVQVLAHVDDRIVAVQYGVQIGLSFHPELDADNRIHEKFLELIAD